MSFFYLCPAKGNIQVHVLEVIVTKRLEHLNEILRNNTIQYNEFVIEGSVYDNIGHFMLCLAAILEQSPDFYKFILKTEKILFQRRLQSLTSYELRSFAKKILKIIRKLDVYSNILEPLQILCQHLSIKHYAHHVTSECNQQCSSHILKLKFIHCLKYLSKRQIDINNGVAQVPCKKWKEYFIILFINNLKNRLYNTPLNNVSCDPRIYDIVRSTRQALVWVQPSPNMLTSCNVDEKSVQFPPCMLHLHTQLRKRHRLSHEQRFNYSLFLKDVGMPINESVEFWKSEYSKSPNNHTCCHNWTKDEKKLLYGIRHMYGLEGGKKSYDCRNCHQIQAIENSTLEGGCPFNSFGSDQLLHLLDINEFDTRMSQINELIDKNQYTKACLLFLQNSHKDFTDSDKLILNFTPVKYYMIASMT